MKESSADVALTTKVKTALSLSKRVPGWGINVDSNDGVVTLRGEVHDADVKSLAEEITRDTNGVTAVRNELSVNAQIAAEAETQQMRDRVGDLEMRYSIHDALVKDPQLRLEDINVEVMNKAVTLSGTVTTSDQKYLAEQIAKKQSGQQTVSNRLEVLQ
jgi:osmotically-inducible protein OsmY